MKFEGSKIEACNAVIEFLNEYGFLGVEQRRSYCDSECHGLNIQCSSYDNKDNWMTKAVRGDYDTYLTDNVGDVSVNDHIKLAWYEIAWHCAPVFLCIIPILGNRIQVFDFKGGIALTSFYGLLAWFGGMSSVMAFYNVVIIITCVAYPSGAAGMLEALSAWIVFVCVLCCTLFVSPVMQILVVIGSIVLYSAYLGSMFMSKRRHIEPAVIIMIVQILIMIEQLSYVRVNMYMSSYSTVIIEMGLNSIYPSGYSSFFVENSFRLTRAALKKMPVPEEYNERAFVLYMAAQILCFLIFRSGLGAFYVSSKRYDVDSKILMDGLATYLSDLFGPLLMVFRMLTGRERVRGKRIAYGVVSASLSWFEMNYAYEIFIIRTGASLFNLVWFGGNFSGAPSVLAINIDMHYAPYPQMKSRPWVSLVKLNEIAEDGLVSVINTRKDGTRSKGVGLVVTNQDKKKLVTVKHVVDNSDKIHLDVGNGDLIQMDNCHFKGHTDCEDPVVISSVGFDCNPPEIDIVTRGEVTSIKDLFFVNKDDDGELMLNSCGAFTVDLNSNTVNAAVDLKHGDSGGPVIGFLKDGTPRYVGAVSKGNPSQLGGNVISLACSKAVHANDSDSDESVGSRLSARWFNHVRNPKRGRRDAAMYMQEAVNIVVEANNESRIDDEVDRVLEDVKSGKLKDTFIDQGREEADAWDDWANDEDVQKRGKERASKSKNRIKSERKERAERKRLAIVDACKFCKIIYDDEASDLLRDCLMDGFDFQLDENQVLGFLNHKFKPVPISMFDDGLAVK